MMFATRDQDIGTLMKDHRKTLKLSRLIYHEFSKFFDSRPRLDNQDEGPRSQVSNHRVIYMK